MTDLRNRAITYARQQPISADMESTMSAMYHVAGNEYNSSPGVEPDTIIVEDPTAFRIGLDNMLAAAFEMGYAAAVDDRTPARPLRDPLPTERRRAAQGGTRDNPLKAKLRK